MILKDKGKGGRAQRTGENGSEHSHRRPQTEVPVDGKLRDRGGEQS